MKKTELVNRIAMEAGISKAEAGRVYDAFVSVVTGALAEGENVSLVGFGTFRPKEVPAKEGKVPGSDKTYHSPAHRTVRFVPGKKLKEAVNA